MAESMNRAEGESSSLSDLVTVAIDRNVPDAISRSINSDAELREAKLPYLQHIARNYCGGFDGVPYYTNDFTTPQQAFFSLLDIETLSAIQDDVATIRRLADTGPPLLGSFVIGQPRTGAAGEEVSRNNAQKSKVMERDGERCVITGRTIAIDCAHIIPFSISSTTGRVQQLCSSFEVVVKLLGPACAGRLEMLLGRLGGSDKACNMFLLNCCMHDYLDKGWCGFRPLRVTKTTTNEDELTAVYTVQFEVHWFSRVRVNPDYDVFPTSRTMADMSMELGETPSDKKRRTDVYILSCNRVDEGDIISIEHKHKVDAYNMFDVMHLRWVAAMFWYLSGSVGYFEKERRDEDDNLDLRQMQLRAAERLAYNNAQQYSAK